MLTGEYNLNPDNRRFNFRPIVVQDMREAIGKIKTSKSLGSDNISSYFLKFFLLYMSLKFYNTYYGLHFLQELLYNTTGTKTAGEQEAVSTPRE